jgi:enhancing lycopene biosynthesis protein 2
MRKSNVNPEDVIALRALLPYGAVREIAYKTDLSEVYVGEILGGRQKITRTNKIVIDEAIKIVTATENMMANTNVKLNRFLSKHKA